MSIRVVLSWSGGKDSFAALLRLEANPNIQVAALVTSLAEPYRRISMHGVPESLLDAQAKALGLPLAKCRLPEPCDNAIYCSRFAATLTPWHAAGIHGIAFGDLFLGAIRIFREKQIQKLGFELVFPLWGEPTDRLAREFIATGHHAILTTVDAEQLDPAFLGRSYDEVLLQELPPTADPCGENGEFHSFVWGGPRFPQPLNFHPGRREVREGRFHFLDLIPDIGISQAV